MSIQPIRVDELTERIRGEYLELPGLRLTPAQAQRLWGLDRNACNVVLTALVEEQFLRRSRDGRFVRTDRAASTSSIGSVA